MFAPTLILFSNVSGANHAWRRRATLMRGSSPVIRSRKQNADAIASAFLFSVADYGIALTRFEVARIPMGLQKVICLLDIWRIAPNMGSEPVIREYLGSNPACASLCDAHAWFAPDT